MLIDQFHRLSTFVYKSMSLDSQGGRRAQLYTLFGTDTPIGVL